MVKQVVQNYKTGELSVQEVPPPHLRPGGVLVRTAYSLISAGTERGMIDLARKNLLQKARERPDLVRKVVDKARTEGALVAYQKALRRLETPMPLGYSSAGTVIAVGEGVHSFEVGDRVACAGIGHACHAEVVFVPQNLCAKLPAMLAPPDSPAAERRPSLTLDTAAYTTVGAVALEGVRTADVRIGDSAVVLGLGLVGLLTVQILRAAGCRVLGMDLNPARCRLAAELGCPAVAGSSAEIAELTAQLTGGHGADAVLVTAATSSSEQMHLAGELARDRARIAVVGHVGVELPRKLYYEKALEVRMSRSYGPGRYDRQYEEKGFDYPIGYVRWTEKRNMEAFLQLVADGAVDVARLTTHRFPIGRALDAYQLITAGSEPNLGVLLEYPDAPSQSTRIAVQAGSRRDHPRPGRPHVSGRCVGLGVIGAGNFASGVLLPALRQAEGIQLRTICSLNGLNARAAAQRFGFAACTSDPNDLFSDPGIQAVLIATRPGSHAALAAAALAAGKHVFVEKPLATDLAQLRCIAERVAERPSHIVTVGYNRRFSPFGRRLRSSFARRSSPLVAIYRVNGGALPLDDRQYEQEEGGGRIIGEVGHFVDLLSYVTGEQPVRVWAGAVGGEGSHFRHENAALTIHFGGGSVGTIVYVTQGAASFSKERLEVFGGGAVGVIEDFRRLELVDGRGRKTDRNHLGQDKGHRAELAAFLDAVRRDGPPPVPFADYALTTLCTLQMVAALRSGQPQPVSLDALDGGAG